MKNGVLKVKMESDKVKIKGLPKYVKITSRRPSMKKSKDKPMKSGALMKLIKLIKSKKMKTKGPSKSIESKTVKQSTKEVKAKSHEERCDEG